MKKKHLLALIFFTAALHAQKTPSKFSSFFNSLSRKVTDVKRGTLDFFFLEAIGTESLSTENEALIYSVKEEVGMAYYEIQVRRMSNSGKILFGFVNWLPFVGCNSLDPSEIASILQAKINYLSIGVNDTLILINEDWFNSLSVSEKRMAIGHELMHIQNRHGMKKAGVALGSCALFAGVEMALRTKKIPQQVEEKGYAVDGIPYVVAGLCYAWYSRKCEREADQLAVRKIGCIDGAISLYTRYIKETTDPDSKFMIKRLLSRVTIKPLSWIMNLYKTVTGAQPEFDTSLRNMKKYKKQLMLRENSQK